MVDWNRTVNFKHDKFSVFWLTFDGKELRVATGVVRFLFSRWKGPLPVAGIASARREINLETERVPTRLRDRTSSERCWIVSEFEKTKPESVGAVIRSGRNETSTREQQRLNYSANTAKTLFAVREKCCRRPLFVMSTWIVENEHFCWYAVIAV